MTRRLTYGRWAIALAVGLVVALGGGVAFAYWSASGSGTGSATTATLNPPTTVTVPAHSDGTVHITWAASAGTPTPTGYYVERGSAAACGTSSTATIAGTSCDDLSVSAGTYSYTVTAVYHTWTATSASSGDVVVQTPSKLVITGQPSNTNAGASISPAVAVTVEDSNGDPVPVAGTSITVAIGTNPGGTLAGTTTANTNTSGVATFSNLSINNAGIGYTLVTTSSGLTGATSNAFNVIGAAARLVITSSALTGTASSSATLGPITIQRQDSVGNPVTGSVAVGLESTSTGAKFAATSGGTAISSITIPAGQSRVDVYYGDTVAGTPTITASSSGLSSATQVQAVTAAAASKFVITSSPVAGVASSSPTLGPITIQRQDTFGNLVTTGSTTVNLASTSTGTKVFAATSGGASITSATILSGASSVNVYYGDTFIGSPTVTASASGLVSATQIEKIGKLCFVSTTGTVCLAGTQNIGNGATFSGRVELVDAANNAIAATVAISVTLSDDNDLQGPSPSTPLTIAAGASVTGTLTDKLANGASKSGTLTGHASVGTVGSDATIAIHA
jgi:hypothetical protein